MKISTILEKIDENQLFVPAFQREYVWKRDDVNHGSGYQNHEDFVFQANRFLAGYGANAEISVRAQSASQ